MSTFTDQGNSIDQWIRSNQPDTNYGGSDQVQIGEPNDSTGQVNRILIKWDLSSIPTDAVVSSATLSLWTIEDHATNTRIWSAYRVLRAWTDGGVTWNKYDGTNAWGTAGCGNTSTDHEATDIGTVSVAGDRVLGEVQISLTPAGVQGWISGALTNNGVLIQTAVETDDHWVCASSAYATAESRPKLVIEYTTGGSQVIFI